MENNRPYWKVVVSLFFSVIATILVVAGGLWGIRFLLPFVIGWILSCIANPAVCWLDKKLKIRKKWGSAIAIILVLGLVIGALYLLLSLLIRELNGWMTKLPQLYQSLSEGMKEIEGNLSGVTNMLPKGIRSTYGSLFSNLGKNLGELVVDLSKPTVSMAGNVAKQLPSVVIGLFVTILSAYFFIADRETLATWVKKITPKSIVSRLVMAFKIFKQAVGGYFIAQFKIMAIVCILLFIGFSLLKIDHAIVLCLLIGFLDFLPFFGTGTALIPWSLYTLLTGDYLRALFLVIIYVITQVVRQLIQPKLVGDEVGMNPLTTLLFIYIGYRMGGFLWMILAVPLGLILIEMYKAGAFDYILDDAKICMQGILSLREKKKE